MGLQRSVLIFCSLILFFGQIAWSQLKIMPLGDSITQGVINLAVENTKNSTIITQQSMLTHEDSTRGVRPDGTQGILGDGNGGYRRVLDQMLKNAGWDLEMVGQRHVGGGDHEGYPGYMSDLLLSVLPQILANNNPDVVLLHIGTNDLPWPIDADSCYKNTVRMVEMIHDYNPDVEIFVAQIIPCLQNTNWAKQRYPSIISLNNKLQQITNGRPYIKLIDMWNAFTHTSNWETQLMCDTWHPNSQGYQLMAEKWRDGLFERIQGRAPLLSSITPDSGEVSATDYNCSITGSYFLDNMQLFLKQNGRTSIAAHQVIYQTANQIQAKFNLTTGSVGQWQVEAENPNKMRSIQAAKIYFNITVPRTYSISGLVKNKENQPLAGTTVLLSFNSTQYKQKTNSSGYYEFGDLTAGQDYQVSVYLAGYHFTPSKYTVQNLQQDQTNLNFNGQNVHLSGYIRKKNGKSVPNVSIRLSGAKSDSTLTNADGFFEFKTLMPGATFITPNKLSWSFIPAADTVTVDTTDLNINFTGEYHPPLYTISGQILDKMTGTGIENMTVKLSGAKTAVALTDSNGFYQFDSLTASLKYIIKPANPDYFFEPTELTIPKLTKSQVINFKGNDLRLAYSISGQILDSLNLPIPDILVRLVSPLDSLTALSSPAGEYHFENLKSAIDYLIYPDDRFGQYAPDSIQIVFLKENLKDQNFIRIVKKTPPQIVILAGQTISEGEQFLPLELDQMAIDPDQKTGRLQWQVIHDSPLVFQIDSVNRCTIQIPDEDWYGRAHVNFMVQDADGFQDSTQVFFIVKNVNDSPKSFKLTDSCDIILDKDNLYHFKWHRSVDPDSGDQVHYYIMIDTSSTNVMRQPMYHLYARLDTILVTPLNFPPGKYFWTVWAGDLKSPLTRCQDISKLTIQSATTIEPDAVAPDAFALRQNYPNPFNPSTIIEYVLPELSPVNLRIYDTRGNLVKELVNCHQPAGQYRVFWNGGNQNGNLVASGRYFCEIKTTGYRKIIQMTFVK